ncbi:MAG TPA: MEDS domain-containing protein [Burkholderiaceae bacterium]|nr:MEDS domain-containing protein [Burkholderiaceae bacterium]
MDRPARPSGIAAVGDIPWGSHFCQFYRTGADLAETIVPYFEAGLRSNESCLWVTGDHLEADAAEALLLDAVPDLKRRFDAGQMEIVPIRKWYTPGDDFDADGVLQGWIDREAESRRRGFSGLRLTGDTFWVDRSGWDSFMEYEDKVNGAFRRYNLVALCTYCTVKCNAEDVLDVCGHHQFALTRRRGTWELLESSSLKLAKEQLLLQNVELERRVEARTAELTSALQARDEFLAMLGHELRNPLAPILTASQLIRAQTPADSPLNRSAAILGRQSRHMSRLVGDLLDVGRITQGQLRLELAETSLSDVLEQALEQSRPLIDQRAQSLSVSLPSRNVTVRADAVRLAQVFANLLHNAAKYTPSGGAVGLVTEVGDGVATVRVRDTGAGIPSSMLESIFNLFTQLPRSLARSEGGLGIGLTLVKRLTEMHGGTVSASSEGAGTGAEFTVTLPIASSGDAMRAPESASAASVAGAGRRILVIDDNEDANQSTAMTLEYAGHRVASAYDGAAGLELARTFAPDAVLLDIGLPDMDGYEVARRLRASDATRHVHVVALTGYGHDSDVERSRRAGIDHHLVKPVRPEEILELIGRLAGPRGAH